MFLFFFFFFSSRRRHTRLTCDWSSDVCSSDLKLYQKSKTVPDGPDRACFVRDRRAPSWISGRACRTPATCNTLCCRSEERRVGKECRSQWSREHEKKKDATVED